MNYFNIKQLKKNKMETKTCSCGVPLSIHNTCCGWENANLILWPNNNEEIEWQRLKLKATNSQIIISGNGVLIMSNGIAVDVEKIPS